MAKTIELIEKYNDNATEKSIVEEKSINPKDKKEDKKKKYPTDDEGNITYVMTEKVLINSKGVNVMGKWDWMSISDFPFMVKNLIKNQKGDVSFIIQVGNDADLNMDEPIFLNVSNEDYSSFAKFRKILRSKQLTLMGKEDHFYMVHQAMPKVSESLSVDILGWNKEAKAYFFSNVAIKDGKAYKPDDFGLIKLNEKSFFMPYVESITGGIADENADKFKFVENKNLNFNSWFQMLFDAHKEYCILPTCFMIASLFRDIIFEETHFMPILYLKGVRGSGKSSIIRNITSVFGSAQKEISLRSNQNTPKSMSRLMAQKSNALLWLDEYHNAVNPNVQGMLQSFYDGAGYQRAAQSNDLKIDSVEIKSSLCLTSNYLPEDEIFFTRTILVQANETKKTTEQREAFKKITNLEKNNLSQIACDLLQYRELIEKEFKENYNLLYEFFFDQMPGIDVRFFDNMACILAPVFILLKHKKIQMVKLDFLNELVEYGRRTIQDQFNLIKENDKSIEFWNIINILFNRNIVRKGVDFKFLESESVDGKKIYDDFLAIRWNRVYQLYLKEAGNRAHGQQEMKEMLCSSEYFVEKRGNIRFTDDYGKPTAPTTAIILKYDKLQKLIGVDFN